MDGGERRKRYRRIAIKQWTRRKLLIMFPLSPARGLRNSKCFGRQSSCKIHMDEVTWGSRYLRNERILAIVTNSSRPKIEENPVAKTVGKSPRKTVRDEKSEFGKDRRRRHHHFLVTVNYADGETFGRVYTDKEKATRFAERQRRSPIVKSARVTQVS